MPVAWRRGGDASLGIIREDSLPRIHPCDVNDYSLMMGRAHLCFEKRQAQLLASLKQESFVDKISNPSATDRSRISGRERHAMVNWALNSYGVERSAMQKQFHQDMIGACAKLIYKQDLEANIDDLLLELGVTELRSEFMAITARRTGKTYSVAMFVVAMLFGVENLEQAIFSTGRRASQKLLELVYRFVCKIPGLKDCIIKHNVETIWFKGPCGDDDIRKISSYPSNPKISTLSSFFSFFCRRSARNLPSRMCPKVEMHCSR